MIFYEKKNQFELHFLMLLNREGTSLLWNYGPGEFYIFKELRHKKFETDYFDFNHL